MKIKSRCEVETEGESYVYEGRLRIIKRVIDVPLTDKIKAGDDKIVTFEIFVERSEKDREFSDSRIFIDEKDIPKGLLKIVEEYSETRGEL